MGEHGYQDFEIEISSREDGGYQVVSRSGGRRSAIVNPTPLDEVVPSPHRGQALFESLFVDAVGEAYRQARTVFLARARGEETGGFRLRLVFGAAGETGARRNPQALRDLNRFASLPWEELHDPQEGNTLLLDGQAALVRSFDTENPDLPFPLKKRARLLLVSCNSNPAAPLDLAEEARRIKLALDKNAFFDLEWLRDPSFSELTDRMQEAQDEGRGFHILHFLGHGGIDEATGEGHLCFVRNRREEERSAAEVAQRLRGFRGLRLVVLNSCHGADVRPGRGKGALGAVALALLDAGVPAVVAMQDAITDVAAIHFADAFYGSLRSSWRIESAVAHGRRRIRDAEDEGADEGEWALPALYMLPRDGRLFDGAKPKPKRGAPPKPLRLAIGSFDGWGKALEDDYDFPLDFAPLFQGRFIDEREGWNREVLQRLAGFLADHVDERRPLHLRFDAHLSIAFAAGYFLDARSGLELTLEQALQGQAPLLWRVSEGEVPAGELWTQDPPRLFQADAADEALAISVSNPAGQGAEAYLDKTGLSVRALHGFTVTGGACQSSVESGAHALRLAQDLRQRVTALDQRSPGATLHVFLSCPKTFAFLLGQVAGPWKRIQLYEWDFLGQRHGGYEPSILLDPNRLTPPRLAKGGRFPF
jgi:hypothetical protein